MSEKQFLERLRSDVESRPAVDRPRVAARRRFSAALNEVVWDVFDYEEQRVLACVRGEKAERRAHNLAADYERMWKRFIQEDRDAAQDRNRR